MYIVTGANGFIGSAIIWQLNQMKIGPILAVDSVSLGERPQPLKGRSYARFLNQNELWNFLAQDQAQEIQWIIHMGACSSTTEFDVEFLKENNTEYTQRLFEWCQKNSKPFIYASSGAVYGDGTQGFSDESDPAIFKPLNPYGESKAAFDRWVVEKQETPPHWYGLRFFNVFGPGEGHKESMSSVVYKAFQQITNHGSLKLFRSHHPDYEDGKQKRDFVYVKDITRWITELIEKKPTSGIYNMGFGRERTWLDLATAVFTSLNVPVKIDWIDIPEEIRDKYQYSTAAEMRKLESSGLTPAQWSLEKGVADYVHFLKTGQEYL